MRRVLFAAAVLAFTSLAGCVQPDEVTDSPQERRGEEPEGAIRDVDFRVNDGFSVQTIVEDLHFPVTIDWDGNGTMYIGTSGFAYGKAEFLAAEVHRVEPNGTLTTIASGFSPPLIDITWHEGRLYVVDRGTVSYLDPADDWSRTPVLTDLPSKGDHHTNEVTFGPDGRLYVPQGIATNAGVVGIDNALSGFGWTVPITEFSDVPCENITLAGVNYVTANAILREPDEIVDTGAEIVEYASEAEIPEEAYGVENESVTTGAYVPFGTPTYRGQVIEGSVPCTGAILVANADGSDLDWYAWGLRNPYGLKFDEEGDLWLAENGADVRGSRPLFASRERFWRVEEGTWYGYPDWDAGVRVNDSRFAPIGEEVKPVILEPPQDARPPFPELNLSIHAAVTKFDFAPEGPFGDARTVYLAEFGDMVPGTGPVGEHSGQRVVRFSLDVLDDRNVEDFLLGAVDVDRRFRPVEAAFGPDGNLYVVNIGRMDVVQEFFGPDGAPREGTGGVFVVVPAGEAEAIGPELPGLGLVAVVGAGLAAAWVRRGRPGDL